MRKQSKDRKPKISKEKLEAAKQYLANNINGQRLQNAEHALTLLVKGELPLTWQYLFNSQFDLRQIRNPKILQKMNESNSKLASLLRNSCAGGIIKVDMEREKLRFLLLYSKDDLNESEAILFSRSLAVVIATTYTTLGLDMSGLMPMDTLADKVEGNV